MSRIKERLRCWMIKKLGGYVHPVRIERVLVKNGLYKTLSSCIEVGRDDCLATGAEAMQAIVTRQLAVNIANEIVEDESLCSIEVLSDPCNPLYTKYRMKVNICNKNE